MSELCQNDQQVSDGANLLISMLVRYPEIGTINFDPEANSLALTFMISGIPTAKEFEVAKQLIINSIAAYQLLEGVTNGRIDVDLSSYEQVAMLTIRRDVHTMSRGEIGLTIKLLRDRFADRLVADRNDAMLEEDLLFQEEVIEDMLENMRRKDHDDHSLIGIREDGRVFVFNK
ncbi:hypothetical protein [Sporomusa malonica]|uniref:Uncharacterized protein n=1 Tax=Sporomusa malonica TaxID=112901 RepID=A0A1W2AV71_9FIRM|nr:hypothetical protein [Sporomusa malonica]SMC64583.1 hypothetical protein SAMN04488500_106145 [Sporomusa malonica]